MFDVGRSFFKTTPHGINATFEYLQNVLGPMLYPTRPPDENPARFLSDKCQNNESIELKQTT